MVGSGSQCHRASFLMAVEAVAARCEAVGVMTSGTGDMTNQARVSAPHMGVTGKAGVAMAVEAHGEARAVAAKEAQEVVAAREALGVAAVREDGKEAMVTSRVAAKAAGKEATVAKEAVGRVALSSQHLLLR
ncbi:hypothetical protein QJQ45_003010 [Haematococcus lacustris]|nr:hypothetical protein QJQ45_003012 [Haematococcus lacustris]KAJ9524852.1 hypothetical protein QJQ45_003010 [Haematococcus lacustris]